MGKHNRIRSETPVKVSTESKATRLGQDEIEVEPVELQDALPEPDTTVIDGLEVEQPIEDQIAIGLDDSDLVYSATTRCQCGAGLAHPKKVGEFFEWRCSRLLSGRAKPNPNGFGHTAPLPSKFYSVSPERSHKALGDVTTRPNHAN